MRPESLKTDRNPVSPRVVYVVDDDGELRCSLHFLLSSKSIYISPFASGIQFLSELDTLRPGPIILDIRMPKMDGVQVLCELAERNIKWPALILTGHGEVGLAVQTLKLGAVDFLEKPASPASLLKAIENAFERLASQLKKGNSRERAETLMASLTPRESEVLRYLCQGYTNKQAAFELSISPRTVEMHRANALKQLNVRTLVEATAIVTAAKPHLEV